MSSNVIHLVSGPRNLSTALMYSFGNRSDFSIIDEPFYGNYLKRTGVIHPGRDEIISSMECDEVKIKTQLSAQEKIADFLFIKNMAHHVMELNYSFIKPFTNVFLIRNTTQILASFSKVIRHPTLNDIGIKQEWELFQYLEKNNKRPIVIDSGILLENPESILTQLCKAIEIPFSSNMLRWPPGPRKEDGIWSKYWYKNVHESTCFKKQDSSDYPIPDYLDDINKEAYFYYQKLLSKAIRI